MRILHVSAIPIWSMKGKGGMPSPRETLKGHVRGGHEVIAVMPAHHLFADERIDPRTFPDEGYAVHLVPCSWLPALKRVRRRAAGLFGGGELPFPVRWVLNFLTMLFTTASLVLGAHRLVRRSRDRFDLVYAHNQYAAPAGWLLSRMLGVPNVTRLYGTFLADLMGKPLVWLRYPVAAAGYLVPHGLLICANDGTRGDEVARRLGIDLTRFRFWQNGVDLPSTRPRRAREEFTRAAPANLRLDSTWIFSCSRLSYWKRIDRMIRALRGAKDADCNVQLLIAGDGPEEGKLRALAAELGIADNVVWLGAMAHEDIWRAMASADVFMITNDVTNRCNPLFEAISVGLPIVSVRDPSTADLLVDGENALLADRNDTNELGKQIVRLCSDGDLARRLAAAQAERARSLWSWRERMAVEVADLERLVRTG